MNENKSPLAPFGIGIMIGAILIALFVIDPITKYKGFLLVILFMIGFCMVLEAGSRERK